MWRAAALIVFLTSESDAKKMLELLDKDRQCFLWTSFFSDKRKSKEGQKANLIDATSLATLLAAYTTFECHKLCKVPFEKRIDHIINVETEKRFVVELKDQNGGVHCVGVDCTSTPKRIFDSQEEYALSLTKENLDRCCGSLCECVGINNIVAIVRKQGKKK